MATDRKDHSKRGITEAESKLSRLLATENELEAILEEARREAAELVEAAQAAAEERVRRFELQLEDENRELAERVARDRDRAIAAIRASTQEEKQRLDELDDAKITELAHYVVDLVVGSSDAGGPH